MVTNHVGQGIAELLKEKREEILCLAKMIFKFFNAEAQSSKDAENSFAFLVALREVLMKKEEKGGKPCIYSPK